jgi:hypothetical protein
MGSGVNSPAAAAIVEAETVACQVGLVARVISSVILNGGWRG